MNKFKSLYFIVIDKDEVELALKEDCRVYAGAFTNDFNRHFIAENVNINQIADVSTWENLVKELNDSKKGDIKSH